MLLGRCKFTTASVKTQAKYLACSTSGLQLCWWWLCGWSINTSAARPADFKRRQNRGLTTKRLSLLCLPLFPHGLFMRWALAITPIMLNRHPRGRVQSALYIHRPKFWQQSCKIPSGYYRWPLRVFHALTGKLIVYRGDSVVALFAPLLKRAQTLSRHELSQAAHAATLTVAGDGTTDSIVF